MGIVFGNVKAGTLVFGGNRIAKAVFGGKTVYKKKDDAWHCPNPFWMEGSTAMTRTTASATGVEGLEYSEDGKTWTATTTFFISKGKRIYFRAKKLNRTSSSSKIIPEISVSGVRVGGDVRSLIEDYQGELVDYAFSRLFLNATNLVDASGLVLDGVPTPYCYYQMFTGCTALTKAPATLPATTFASCCCQQMFKYCSSLTQAPELPATTLATYCYQQMFYGCSKLTQAPELPATTLAMFCYGEMFFRCWALTKAPATLPATTLATYCYSEMFCECTALTEAPALPATTLMTCCYQYMFADCTSLTQSPELPATKLVSFCYSNMFNGCTNLNEVKVGVTTWNTSNASEWLKSVAATGTFYKRTGVSIPTGTNGIPSGWTVVEYDPAA